MKRIIPIALSVFIGLQGMAYVTAEENTDPIDNIIKEEITLSEEENIIPAGDDDLIEKEEIVIGETEDDSLTLIEEELPAEEMLFGPAEEVPDDTAEEAPEISGVSADKAEKLPAPVITGVYNSRKGGDIYWNKVNGATGYIVYRFRAAEKTKKVIEVDANTTHVYDQAILDNCWGRVYHYYVVGIKNGVAGHWSKPAVLQRVASLNLSVANAGTGAVKASWSSTAENKAKGYQLQYAESKDDLFHRKGTFRSKTFYKRSIMNTTVSGLTVGKTWYFRVRAYVDYINSGSGAKTKTWSQYSDVKAITVKNNTLSLAEQARKAYAERLSQTYISFEGVSNVPASALSFVLVDFDNNGIPELYVHTSGPGGLERFKIAIGNNEIWSFESGKLVRNLGEDLGLDDLHGLLLNKYYPSRGIYQVEGGFKMMAWEKYYLYQNGVNTLMAKHYSNGGYPDASSAVDEYYNGSGAQITKSAYDTLVNSLISGASAINTSYPYHANTAANRNEYILK